MFKSIICFTGLWYKSGSPSHNPFGKEEEERYRQKKQDFSYRNTGQVGVPNLPSPTNSAKPTHDGTPSNWFQASPRGKLSARFATPVRCPVKHCKAACKRMDRHLIEHHGLERRSPALYHYIKDIHTKRRVSINFRECTAQTRAVIYVPAENGVYIGSTFLTGLVGAACCLRLHLF